jgi:hypothetical protein
VLKILSLGAGVQSTTIALLSKHGELPPLDCAIFADTGWEPKAVYRHLAWLELQLPFPVHRVTAGDSIRDEPQTRPTGKFINLPVFIKGAGRSPRQCTRHWKIEPIHQKIRELLGLARYEHAKKWHLLEKWIGISLDEADRMRDSEHTWIQHRYPLCFDLPKSRQGCLTWLKAHGYPEPPRSACIPCPFHSSAEWRALKNNSPDEFQEAVAFEKKIQAGMPENQPRPFLHQSRRPLEQVDFSTPEDHGQLNWLDECTGMCGN